jgi:predicted DNA-binding transcriptional regulator AlpA
VRIPELVGATEIADLLGVTRQRVQQLANEAGFPAPVAILKMGKVWVLDDVRAWAERTGRELH